MQTKNIIQASANVIRITSLKVGDIYKRYEDSTYSTGVYYGIVKAIANNGENTFIEAIEYKKSYSSIDADFKVWGGEKDIAIFPATVEELTEEFGGVEKRLLKEITDKEEEIEAKKKCIAETRLLLSGELSKQLQSAEHRSMTQGEYIALKAEKAKQIEI